MCSSDLRTAALGFELDQAVTLEALDSQPLPPLLDPLPALAHLPRQTLAEPQVEGWRCGRSLQAEPQATGRLAPDAAVAVLWPSGTLAGIARLGMEGWLQPRLVLDAIG